MQKLQTSGFGRHSQAHCFVAGNGKTLASVVDALGGGYIGNQVAEKNR
jgi:uncharacterized protein YcfJ